MFLSLTVEHPPTLVLPLCNFSTWCIILRIIIFPLSLPDSDSQLKLLWELIKIKRQLKLRGRPKHTSKLWPSKRRKASRPNKENQPPPQSQSQQRLQWHIRYRSDCKNLCSQELKSDTISTICHVPLLCRKWPDVAGKVDYQLKQDPHKEYMFELT